MYVNPNNQQRLCSSNSLYKGRYFAPEEFCELGYPSLPSRNFDILLSQQTNPSSIKAINFCLITEGRSPCRKYRSEGSLLLETNVEV